MIMKGNQRGGGQQLASHLMNSFDNERVEVAEVSGAVAQDLSGAFAEWEAQASATKMERKFYYHLMLNPDQAQGRLTREQYYDLIARTERSLNLVGQPRAVVFHEKRDFNGVPREHCHVAWSRVDMRREKIKAVEISHDRLKLRTVAREFCRDHGLELPDGMKPGRAKGSRRARFNENAKENHAERQQKERTGIPKEQRMADIATCWKETGNGAAFVAALQGKGYFLARGDSRDYVVVDVGGEIHSLSRQLKGEARPKEMRERLKSHPPEKLPGAEAVQDFLREKRRDAIRKAFAQKEITGPSAATLRRQALVQHQHKRRADLDQIRIDLIGRHMSERDGLKAAQEAQKTGIVSARLQKKPKGFMAFLTRVTGISLIVSARQSQQDKARDAAQAKQAEALKRTHDREMHEIDRRYHALERLENYENKSADLALKREEFELLLQNAERALKPEFDRAAQQALEKSGAGDGKSLKDKFEKAAKPPVDLVEEFNREVEGRTTREKDDRDLDGPDRSFDPEKD
jgi:hypothetical protein